MMKKCFLFLLTGLFLISASSHATKCLQWKNAHCFRCVKPSQYNFHAYSRQVNRATCNDRTADYLRTMGYRCYKPTLCAKFEEKTKCARR